jgi:DNA polymerase-3 subunit beta
MDVSCLQETLNKGLGVVGRAVANRTTLPITQNVLIVTDQGRLRLTATNLEVAISTWIGSTVEEEGEITVPARLLTDFVGSLQNERVDVKTTTQPHAMELSCARNHARIIGTDAAEFPPIPTVEEGVVAKVSSRALRAAIVQVVFAAATEESRPVLTGVKMEIDEDRLTLAAADGFRLAVHHGTLQEAASEATEVIIPGRTMNELNRLLSDDDEPVEMVISSSRGQALFRFKDVEMVSQLIQGSFPNYSQLIPERYTTRAGLQVDECLRAARTASIFARDSSGIVRLHIQPGSPGALQFVARADEVGENSAEMDAEVEGDEAKIAFNAKYLTDVLGVIGTERVALEVTTPSSPGVLRPKDTENYIHVVMPMFVQW